MLFICELFNCRAANLGMKLEWLEDGGVKTIIGPVPGVKYDEKRRRKIWFNSMVVAYDWEDKRNDSAMIGKMKYDPVTFGDGQPLPLDVIYDCLKIMEEESVAIPWRKGDVMLLDNWSVLHSRRPSHTPRRVLASLVMVTVFGSRCYVTGGVREVMVET